MRTSEPKENSTVERRTEPRIVVDLLSADRPAEDLLEGLIEASESCPCSLIVIVPHKLRPICSGHPSIDWIYTDDYVRMGDAPPRALRRMPRASILRAVSLLAQSKADALFSPGHTGATITASVMKLKRFDGVRRPALMASLVVDGIYPKILVDVGANVSCKPDMLVQFALMGSAYSRCTLNIAKPKVALLNVGGERGKGPHSVADAYARLDRLPLNFVGNIEANNLLSSYVDVVVCDGFVGNVVLKLLEGVFLPTRGDANLHRIQSIPLIGVNRLVMVGHGNIDSKGIIVAIENTVSLFRQNIIQKLQEELRKLTASHWSFLRPPVMPPHNKAKDLL